MTTTYDYPTAMTARASSALRGIDPQRKREVHEEFALLQVRIDALEAERDSLRLALFAAEHPDLALDDLVAVGGRVEVVPPTGVGHSGDYGPRDEPTSGGVADTWKG